MKRNEFVTDPKSVTKSQETPSGDFATKCARTREDLIADRLSFEGPQTGIAGNGRAAAAQRRKRFIDAYLANGHNATQAAITAGFSPKTACAQGQRLLRKVEVSGEIARAAERAAVASGLLKERSLREVARLAYSDMRQLFRSDGTLKDLSEMDDDTAATIASIETVEERSDGGTKTVVRKVKLWDKNAALDKAMKHLGLYQKDNSQRGPIQIEVELVG